ncbi:MAG: tetratricopeptide repeat protein, partial [Planctomycetota bacterium]
ARAIEDALLLKPGDPELYCSLIRFLLFATKYEEAVEVAEKARKTSPNHWKVAMMHADALYWEASAAGLIHLSKDAGDAEKKEREAKITLVTSIYAESAKLGPGQAEPRQRLGAFLLQTGGDKDKAIAEYVAAISKNPASADVSAVLPVLSPKELLDLFTKAQSEFNKNHPKVADADPADVMIWWYLGYAKYLSDDRKGATEAFQRVITKTPSDMTARYYLGRILALDQKWKDAAAQFETIAKKSPKALADLGRSDTFFVPTVQLLVSKLLVPDDAAGPVTGLADGPELRTAILFTRAILELQPNNIVEWNNIGLFYRDSGNGKEALYAYKKALELNPTDPRLLNDTAVVYHYSLPQSKENDEEIKRLYERSIARAKEVIADKRSGAIEKENAQSALKDATGNLARFLRGDRRNN